METLDNFMDSFSNDWVCENCGKHFTEDYRTKNTLSTSIKRVGKVPRFCSIECSHDFPAKGKRDVLERWKQGEDLSSFMSISSGVRIGELSLWFWTKIKDYLLDEQRHKCLICDILDSWNNQPLTFVLDHIDGDYKNQKKDNLRLICPNCNSQLETTKARHEGRRSHKYHYYAMKDKINYKSNIITDEEWKRRLNLLTPYNKKQRGWKAKAARDLGVSKRFIQGVCNHFGIKGLK